MNRKPFDRTYRRGPEILRGKLIPKDSSTAALLQAEQPSDWLHMDPWRVLRIQSEWIPRIIRRRNAWAGASPNKTSP